MSTQATVVPRLHDALMESRRRIESRDDDIVRDQIAIAGIPSPTGAEGRRAEWMATRLGRSGLDDVSIDAAGNVVAIRRGSLMDDHPVVVCAHLDTVVPSSGDVGVRRQADRLLAPGIGDNARGLAVLAALADEFARLRPRRAVVLAATTGEEGTGDLRGARFLFDTVARGAHAAIAIDGAGDERIVACALGCRRYRVEYRGAGGHSWAAFGMPNAVHATAGLATRLSQLPFGDCPRTTLTVSRIGGGSAINAIPADGWLEVDMRSTSAVELARLDRQLHVAAQGALDDENARRRAHSAPLAVSFTLIGDRPAGEVPEQEALVQAAVRATRLVGRAPEMAIASTDANIPISLGIPAVAIGGGGRGGDTHTPHEWYENREGSAGVVRALVILSAAAGVA